VRGRAVVVFHMFAVATWGKFIEVPVVVAVSRVSLVLASPQKVLFGVKCTLPSRTVKMYCFGRKIYVIYSGLRLRLGVLVTEY
jgi:hypothetical protein